VEGRCPIDPNAPEAWGPGDLDEMFTKLTAEPYLSKYSVEILSSPSTGGPWVLTLDDVVSEEEAERLIELGATQGYKRSTDVGKILPDGNFEEKVSTGRTSTNAWCNDECGNDEVAQRVAHRISNFTGIDDANSEYLQLLKYEPGQFYKTHHDYIAHEENRQQGKSLWFRYRWLTSSSAQLSARSLISFQVREF
jgi:prolyl 4-hydroxylase